MSLCFLPSHTVMPDSSSAYQAKCFWKVQKVRSIHWVGLTMTTSEEWLPTWYMIQEGNIPVSRALSIGRRRQWHPTPVLLPGNAMDRGAW